MFGQSWQLIISKAVLICCMPIWRSKTAGAKVGEASLFAEAVNELRAKKKQKSEIDMCIPECLIFRDRVVAFVVYGDPHSGCFHSHHDAEILLEGCPFRPE